MADIKLKLKKTDGTDLTLPNAYIDSITSTSQSTTDASGIQYGVLANSGSVKIRDIDGSLKNMIIDGELENSNVPSKILVNGNQIQEHITNDSDYDEQNTVLSLQFTNSINDWNKLIYAGRKLTDSTDLYSLLKEIMLSLNANYNIDKMMNAEIRSRLSLIMVSYPYLESDTYTNTINKICTLAQLQCVLDKTGYPKFIDARPLHKYEDFGHEIQITPITQINNFKKSIVLKNKFDGVNIQEYSMNTNYINNEECGNATANNIQYTSESDGVTIASTINEDVYSRYLKLYYQNISVSIPKKFNNNFNIIDTINNFTTTIITEDNRKIEDITTYKYISSITNIETKMSPEIARENNVYMPEERILSITDNGIEILIDMFVCVGRDTEGSTRSTQGNETVTDSVRASSIKFTFYGNTIKTEFQKTNVSSENINSAKTIANIEINELLQNETKLDDEKISSIIKNEILTDYYNGISNGNIDLFCQNMYNKNSELIKNWDKGEIIETGDIIYFDKDFNSKKEQRYWRVTSRTFNDNGSPSLSLELLELNNIKAGLYIDKYYTRLYKDWNQLISEGLVVLTDNSTTISSFNSTLIGVLFLPTNIKKIGKSAFNNSKLLGIVLNNGIEDIGKEAFKQSNIEYISIPDTVTNLGAGAFDNCPYLANVDLSHSIDTIYHGTFSNCYSLKSINIPSNIKILEAAAFYNCIELSDIQLNEGLQYIGKSSKFGGGAIFNDCKKLKQITFPSSLINIASYSFGGVDYLSSAIFKNTNGWTVNGTAIDVTNPETNATNLKITYLSSTWART